MNDVHEKWMWEAYREAEKARDEDEVPIGAILVCEDREIARGRNLRETKGQTAAHAEMEALLAYNQASKSWRLPEGTSLYVTLEPCLMCTGAFLWARVHSIYFGCPDTKNAGLLRTKPWIDQNVFDHIPKEVRGGILEEKCGTLLSTYFKGKRIPQK